MIASVNYDRPRDSAVSYTATATCTVTDSGTFSIAVCSAEQADRAEGENEAIDIDQLFAFKSSGRVAARPRESRLIPQEDAGQPAQLGLSKPTQLPSGYG